MTIHSPNLVDGIERPLYYDMLRRILCEKQKYIITAHDFSIPINQNMKKSISPREGLIKRTLFFLENNIFPINCFDRHLSKEIDLEMIDDCKRILKKMGLPIIEAPGEAEAQCCYLVQKGIADAVVTEDNDPLLYPHNVFIKNLSPSKKDEIKFIFTEDFYNKHEINHEQFIHAVFFIGFDNFPGVKTYRLPRSTKLVRKFSNFSDMVASVYKKFENSKVSYFLKEIEVKNPPEIREEDLKSKEAFMKFIKRELIIEELLNPTVSREISGINFGDPDLEGLRSLLLEKCNLEEDTVDDYLKRLKESSPSNIKKLKRNTSFFQEIKKLRKDEIEWYTNSDKKDEHKFHKKSKRKPVKKQKQSKKWIEHDLLGNRLTDTKLIEKILKEGVLDKDKIDILRDITFREKDPYNLEVIAQAGSGKTTLIEKILELLLIKQVKQEKILIMAPYHPAAENLRKRIRDPESTKLKISWIGTFHSIGYRVISSNIKFLRENFSDLSHLRKSFIILDKRRQRRLIEETINKIDKAKIKGELSSKDYQKIFNKSLFYEESVTKAIQNKFLEHNSPEIIESVEFVYSEYKKEKSKSNVLDFSDLLRYWKRLLELPLKGKEILNQFKYVIIDEFQTINPFQFEIIDTIREINPKCNFIIVGDPDQTIHSYNGADPIFFKKFKVNFNAHVKFLKYNYRSPPEIVNLYNDSIRHNRRLFEIQMISAMKNCGVKPHHIILPDEEAQAIYSVKMIKELVKGKRFYRDIAILARINSHLNLIKEKLEEAGIPFKRKEQISFLQRDHISDVLAYLIILQSKYDKVSWKSILTMIPRVGDAKFEEIFENIIKGSKDPYNSLINDYNLLRLPFNRKVRGKDASKIRRNIKDLVEFLKKLETIKKPKEIFECVQEYIGEGLKQKYKKNWKSCSSDIEKLAKHYEEFTTIKDVLEDILLSNGKIDIQESESPEKNLVTLSTIHSAQGKQWPIVFIIMLAQNYFPYHYAINDKNEIAQEERRVFAEGLTRAKDKLFLITPQLIIRGSDPRTTKVSTFISELNPDVYIYKIVKSADMIELNSENLKNGKIFVTTSKIDGAKGKQMSTANVDNCLGFKLITYKKKKITEYI